MASVTIYNARTLGKTDIQIEAINPGKSSSEINVEDLTNYLADSNATPQDISFKYNETLYLATPNENDRYGHSAYPADKTLLLKGGQTFVIDKLPQEEAAHTEDADDALLAQPSRATGVVAEEVADAEEAEEAADAESSPVSRDGAAKTLTNALSEGMDIERVGIYNAAGATLTVAEGGVINIHT